MTNIEFIKLIVYGNLTEDAPINDSAINDIIEHQGVNICIEILARTQLNKLLQQPTNVNDGAVSLSWNDRKTALEDIIKKAEQGLFTGPETDNKKPNQFGVVYT